MEAVINAGTLPASVVCLQQRQAHLRGHHDPGLGVEAFLGRIWCSGT